MVSNTPSEQKCSKCGFVQDIREFNVDRSKKAGRKSYCRTCATSAKLLSRYHLSLDQYNAILYTQGGVCAICKRPEKVIDPRTDQTIRLAVDHDHACCPGRDSCGKCVRGLLCAACNVLISVIEEETDALDRAAHYLIYHRMRQDEMS